jgi:hypothetical protein
MKSCLLAVLAPAGLLGARSPAARLPRRTLGRSY